MADQNISRTQSITVTENVAVQLTYPDGYTFEINVADRIRVFDWGGPYSWVGRYIEDFSALTERVETRVEMAEIQNMKARGSGWEVQGDVKYGGSNALRVIPGGSLDILYACDAGSTEVKAYCYYTLGANPRMEIRKADGSDELVTFDEPSGGVESWEQLTCSFTATKGFYIIRFLNKKQTEASGTSAFAVFDDIE